MRILQFSYDPVIQWSVILKLQRTDGVGDSFNGILNGVRKVVHRVNTPCISRMLMGQMRHTVNDRISHIDIGRCHIDLCTERSFSIGKAAVLHLFKQFQIFFYAAVSAGIILTGLCQSTTILSHLFCRKLGNISLSLFDQLHSTFIHLFKIIRCKEQPVFPVSSKPFDICQNGIYKFCLLLRRVGIIKTHIELAAILFCKSII